MSLLRRGQWLMLAIWDSRGQDIVEYALLAGLVATTCGALLPPVSSGILDLFSRVTAALDSAGTDNSN